jgi:hypothetical protein
MVDLNAILEAQRQFDNLSGAARAQRALLEQPDTLRQRAIQQQIDLFSGAAGASKALFDHIDRQRFSIVDQYRNELAAHIAGARGFDLAQSSPLQESLRLAEKTIAESYLDNLNVAHRRALQDIKAGMDKTFAAFSGIGSIKNEIDQLRESLSRPFHSQNSELFRGYEEAVRAATLSSVGAFSKTLLENRQLRNENLFKQVSSSLLSYDHFANQTLAELRATWSEPMASALQGSLRLANEQLLRSTSAFDAYAENLNIDRLDQSDLFLDRQFPKVNRYRIQKQELLRRDDIEEDEDYESLVIKSPSAISFDQISNCMTLIGLCNEASEATRGETIFTLTSMLWLSAWKLVSVVPTNKDNFAIVVDCLYLMLYEGAGKDKLRFIEHGYIDGAEAEVIWKIKHLRNKWLRHDIDHGEESKIKKSRQNLRDAFEWFGLRKVPYSKNEFVFLYNGLILKVEEFLKLLLDRVSRFSD